MSDICLVTLPHAGGSTLAFKKWKRLISSRIVNIEYPGHWIRLREPLLFSFDDLAEDVMQEIKKNIGNATDIVMFGHSLGAILAWHIVEKIEQYDIKVRGLFLSGSQNPGSFPEPCILDADSDEKILDLIGYRAEKINDTNDMYFRRDILPIVCSDLEICKSYKATKIKKDVNSFVFYGLDDVFTKYNEILKWNEYTELNTIIGLNGGHLFFLDKSNSLLISTLINNYIDSL